MDNDNDNHTNAEGSALSNSKTSGPSAFHKPSDIAPLPVLRKEIQSDNDKKTRRGRATSISGSQHKTQLQTSQCKKLQTEPFKAMSTPGDNRWIQVARRCFSSV
jgi:hypothetical protein